MCICNPKIRSIWCGKGSCQPPTTDKFTKTETDVVELVNFVLGELSSSVQKEAKWAFHETYLLGVEDSKSKDSVVETNRQLLLDRSNVGIQKYGVTLEKANLSEEAILQHALEEALDLANYLQTRLMVIRGQLNGNS